MNYISIRLISAHPTTNPMADKKEVSSFNFRPSEDLPLACDATIVCVLEFLKIRLITFKIWKLWSEVGNLIIG